MKTKKLTGMIPNADGVVCQYDLNTGENYGPVKQAAVKYFIGGVCSPGVKFSPIFNTIKVSQKRLDELKLEKSKYATVLQKIIETYN